jgi:hypothetical protein
MAISDTLIRHVFVYWAACTNDTDLPCKMISWGRCLYYPTNSVPDNAKRALTTVHSLDMFLVILQYGILFQLEGGGHHFVFNGKLRNDNDFFDCFK